MNADGVDVARQRNRNRECVGWGMQQKVQRKVRRTTRDAAARLAWSGTLGFGAANYRANQQRRLHGTTSIFEGDANGTIDCEACEGDGGQAMAWVAVLW